MSTIPAIHTWNLTNYARRKNLNSTLNNEYFWLCLNSNETSLKMMITPTLQLMIVSSDQCIEELVGKDFYKLNDSLLMKIRKTNETISFIRLIDIWLMLKSMHIHVHCKSLLFIYTWPPSTTNIIRSFRIKFQNDIDRDQCLHLLRDYIPINIYSPDNIHVQIESSQPKICNSLVFDEIKDLLTIEQTQTMNMRTDFIRQYLSICIMDPTFHMFVNKNEEILKNVLIEK